MIHCLVRVKGTVLSEGMARRTLFRLYFKEIQYLLEEWPSRRVLIAHDRLREQMAEDPVAPETNGSSRHMCMMANGYMHTGPAASC